MPDKPFMVAEIKTLSPYGFKSPYEKKVLQDLAITSGEYVSVHTDPRWGGGMIELYQMCERVKHGPYTNQKVLAKGIHPSDDYIKAALDSGADYVLVVGRIPSSEYLSKCWLEPTTMNQLNTMLDSGVKHIVLNSRDLQTGESSKVWNGLRGLIAKGCVGIGSHEDIKEYIASFFQDLKKNRDVNLVQASGIKTRKDIESWADGFIVGEHLAQFTIADSIANLEEHFERIHSKAPEKAN